MEPAAQPGSRPGAAAWVYVALTVAVLGTAVAAPVLLRPPDLTWSLWLGFVVGQAPLVGAAAFHLRHPDAWRSARMIALAFVALAAAALMEALGALVAAIGDLRRDFEGVAAGANIGSLALIPFVVGCVLLWIGLRRVRRQPTATRGSMLVRAVRAVVAVELALILAVVALGIVEGGASGLLLGFLLLLATAPLVTVEGLLTTTLWGGAAAGEQPTLAWWIGGAAWAVQLVGLPIAIAIPDVGLLVLAAGAACLVIAFALGLPATGALEASPAGEGTVAVG